mmetsp:Transcript_4629/g.6980  ORF Transcript_4629/g.6980 Transcript_4629/m.6980 type:complete len:378 (-) Transcript_4629:52-1185(-)
MTALFHHPECLGVEYKNKRSRFFFTDDESSSADVKKENAQKNAYIGKRKGQNALYAPKQGLKPGEIALEATKPLAHVIFKPNEEDFFEPHCANCAMKNVKKVCKKCKESYLCPNCISHTDCGLKGNSSQRLATVLLRDYASNAYIYDNTAVGNHCQRVLSKLRRYGHTIIDEELRVIGYALYEEKATAANHSCTPNIWPQFYGIRLVYRALREIKPNEELCIEYVDSALSKSARRALLCKGYDFFCICPRCFCSSDDSDIAQQLNAARNVAECAIEARDFDSALSATQRLTPLLQARYIPFHPHIGLHFLRLAKLMLATNYFPAHNILATLNLALNSLSISHHSSSHLLSHTIPELKKEVLLLVAQEEEDCLDSDDR